MVVTDRLGVVARNTTPLVDVTLSIRSGETVAVVGDSGSGRQTLFEVLATLRPPTSGRASIQQVDVRTEVMRARKLVGYSSAAEYLPRGLRVGEYLEWIARSRGMHATASSSATRDAAHRFDLSAAAWLDELADAGRRAVGVTGALLHAPAVALLDRSFAGLDDSKRPMLALWVADRGRAGLTTLIGCLSSDEAASVAELCGTVLRFDAGRLVDMQRRTRPSPLSEATLP